jgi:hypothetical protein
VLNALRKFSGRKNFGIQVVTGKNQALNEDGAWYYNRIITNPSNINYGEYDGAGITELEFALNETSRDYINPSGKFKGKVIRDKNGAVSGIVFEQQ